MSLALPGFERLECCPSCQADTVMIAAARPPRRARAAVTLRCGSCGHSDTRAVSLRTLARLERICLQVSDEMADLADALELDAFKEWANRFIFALRADHIQVEDF